MPTMLPRLTAAVVAQMLWLFAETKTPARGRGLLLKQSNWPNRAGRCTYRQSCRRQPLRILLLSSLAMRPVNTAFLKIIPIDP